MSPSIVFVLQVVWFTVAWGVLVRLVIWPWSQGLAPNQSVAVWVAPQMFRVLGLGLLVPNLSPGMPPEFAIATAAGDALTAVLAVAAFVALQRDRRSGYALAWACTVVGSADGIHAVVQAARLGVADHLAAQWYVPALGVPLMGISHVACLVALLRSRSEGHTARHP